jgi:hypothetical protein
MSASPLRARKAEILAIRGLANTGLVLLPNGQCLHAKPGLPLPKWFVPAGKNKAAHGALHGGQHNGQLLR